MRELDKNKVYDLSELTSEERNDLYKITKNPYIEKNVEQAKYLLYSRNLDHWQVAQDTNCETANAKELFYTLENVQVHCKGLTSEEIANISDIIYYRSGTRPILTNDLHIIHNSFRLDENKTTITYDRFMDLFGDQISDVGIDTFNPQPHYNNENGSLYKIANDLGLNHWEFDVFKRLVRCRKKNQFKEDLQKIKDTIDIYLNEY